MRITTSVTFQMTDTIGEYIELSRESFEYDGPVALCKKGRGAQQQNTQFQQQQAQGYAGTANSLMSQIQSLLNGEIGSTTPGSMSPDAAAVFSSDLQNINNTYNGLRQNLFSNATARGFGSAPSGFTTTSLNALTNGQNNAATQAYNQGQINTQQERQNALGTASGLYGTATSGELGNTGAATNSAFDQSRMGSTLGDILSGASSILGGISGVGNLIKNWTSSNVAQTPSTDNLPMAPQLPASLNTYNSNVAGKSGGVGSY